ncbi:DUF4430 domain-containing protein [Anaerofustis sp.]|uniref:DUF4430 domain-containing protein n=1 Tax=Anaerofustis sp. TaxID=1872517 RepID=UPI0025C1179E|nr:DUF4430 domain-containing protein [Anaerofustis sp.]
MGKIRYNIIVFALLSIFLLTGCSGQNMSGQNQDKTVSKQISENVKDKSEGIPDDLIPKDAKKEKNDDSGVMEIVESDGTVHKAVNSDLSGKKNKNVKGSGNNGSSQNINSGSSSGSFDSSKKVIEISFSIDSSNADNSVSYSAVMTLDAGSTVYDALAASGISHSGKSYVSSIGGLSEKMFGSQSGWKYYVNGSSPNKSCVNYTLKNGDRVQWRYVLKS